ncbi:MAG TPA: 6-carboxytetrahydropterin synthase QueD [Thermoanaerobaculia bacterium]|nr:6-carboxytetrahydropterin synthase QueD [Thermoanaerobaculia bacterium]
MFSVSKEFSISAAHYIPDHPGKCRRLHGHNYRVRLVASAERLDELGMVVDFSELKRVASEILDRYDHRVLNEIEPFDTTPPTAEAISELVYREASRRLDDERVRVSRVEVWENQRSCAVFEPR